MNTPLDHTWQLLDGAETLKDGGKGLRFDLLYQQQEVPAFVIKHDGQHYAYLNQCAHIAMELDWQPEHFFDADGQWLMCASHGALYEPGTGLCVNGPCQGASLKPIALQTIANAVYAPKYL
jgi:nitrite reductase/ring-hydroxylating ferredoxin subunit